VDDLVVADVAALEKEKLKVSQIRRRALDEGASEDDVRWGRCGNEEGSVCTEGAFYWCAGGGAVHG